MENFTQLIRDAANDRLSKFPNVRRQKEKLFLNYN